MSLMLPLCSIMIVDLLAEERGETESVCVCVFVFVCVCERERERRGNTCRLHEYLAALKLHLINRFPFLVRPLKVEEGGQ